MASFLSSVTSKYLFNEAAAPILDTVGSKDITVGGGAPTFNQPGVTVDSVDDYVEWGVDTASPVRGSINYNFYITIKITTLATGLDRVLMGPSELGANREGPTLRFNDSGFSNTFRLFSHSAAGNGIINLALGRAPNIGETFVLLGSNDRAGKVLNFVVRSDQGINLSGTATPTQDPGWQVTTQMFLNTITVASIFYGMELLEVGVEESPSPTATIPDLQATADELLGIKSVSKNLILTSSTFGELD